jgi:hypothetical protein
MGRIVTFLRNIILALLDYRSKGKIIKVSRQRYSTKRGELKGKIERWSWN